MATYHSRPKRTKSTNCEIVVPPWDNVWASFNEEHKKTTIEAMNKDGWKTVDQVASECGLSRVRVSHIANNGTLERVKRKILIGGVTREVNFVRPKI